MLKKSNIFALLINRWLSVVISIAEQIYWFDRKYSRLNKYKWQLTGVPATDIPPPLNNHAEKWACKTIKYIRNWIFSPIPKYLRPIFRNGSAARCNHVQSEFGFGRVWVPKDILRPLLGLTSRLPWPQWRGRSLAWPPLLPVSRTHPNTDASVNLY